MFFSGWKSEQLKRHETGERFCIQCHSPVAYVSGIKLDKYTSVSELQNDPELSGSIKEGVTCTVCHSFTGISKTVETGYNVAAKAEYHMNPGEGIMYGPIESSAEIDSSATIKPFASISENVVIQEGVTIGEGVYIGKNSLISSNSKICPNVSIYSSVEIGRECIIHSGTVIGSDGLGFARKNNSWEKVEHLGGVIIGDRVEIGSNTSIDKGSLESTNISDEVKIDNLVHIAHNVFVGSATVIAANSAIAGSTKVGKNCTIAGCCGIVDNIEIADSVHITAMTLVTKSIKKSGTYSSGTPIMENKEWRKNAIAFKKLKDLINNLK